MLDTANLRPNGITFNCHLWQVLFARCIDRIRFDFGHLFAAAHQGHTGIKGLDSNIAAMEALIKF